MIEVTSAKLEQYRKEKKNNFYQKLPITIEAFQMESNFVVETLEGTMKGKKGDYLLVGIEGEFYPCNREIFERTYVQV